MIFTEALNNYNMNKSNEYNIRWDNLSVANSCGNSGGSYMHDALYESYIQAKIDSENRLALALKESMVISESDYSNIRAIQEARVGDKIKSKWNKFVAFIKNMFAKFMESISNILLDEKEYLEKYKDIILKKTPKDLEYSYTGDYNEGTKRIIGTFVPIFSYTTYKNELEAEGVGQLANALVKGFNYVDGDDLAVQYKEYFLNLDAGQKTGKLSELNMTSLYNFCHDFSNIKKILDKNLANIDASTRAIETEINKQITPVSTNTTTNPETTKQESASYIIEMTPSEANEKVEKFNEKDSKDKKEETSKTTTNLSVKPSSAMQNTDRDENVKAKEKENAEQDANEAKKTDTKSEAITKAADKWIEVTKAIVSAQLTACQQIAKDYMEIIRAHVRSYGGTSKKDKTGDTSPKAGQTYEKSKELKDAEEANKAAGEKLKQKQKETSEQK